MRRWVERTLGVALLLCVVVQGIRLMERLNHRLYLLSLPTHSLSGLRPWLWRWLGAWLALLGLAYGGVWLLFRGEKSSP